MNRREFLAHAGKGAVALCCSQILPAPAFASQSQIIRELPSSETKRVAWTVDDGTSTEAVRRYTRLVAENDLRLTFFIYSSMASWIANKNEISPLVQTGQIQLANHTMHHPALASLSSSEIKKELMGAHNFIEKNFGVDVRPYFRPPYGSISQKVVEAAAEIGYTRPMLWSGSLGDASNIRAARVLVHARESFHDRSIVLAHANNLTSSKVFPSILKLINSRELQLVTLQEALDS